MTEIKIPTYLQQQLADLYKYLHSHQVPSVEDLSIKMGMMAATIAAMRPDEDADASKLFEDALKVVEQYRTIYETDPSLQNERATFTSNCIRIYQRASKLTNQHKLVKSWQLLPDRDMEALKKQWKEENTDD